MEKTKIIAFGIIILIIVILIGILISSFNKAPAFSEISKQIIDSVVTIEIEVNGAYIPDCTGFIVDSRGYVITAYHCFGDHLKEYNDFTNRNYSVQEFVEKAGVAHITKNNQDYYYGLKKINNSSLDIRDVLLVKLEDYPPDLRPVEIANKEKVDLGIEVGFIGYAQAEENNSIFYRFIGKAILSNIDFVPKNKQEPYYTISAFSIGGFSGGPVYLPNGKVIGIIKGTIGDNLGRTGIVYVPPIHDIPEIIKDLEENS